MPNRQAAPRRRVVIIGAGIGGLSAALLLAAAGQDVTVLERAATPGGKLRQVIAGGAAQDAGPTVFTMRWVFDALFADAGARLEDHLTLAPATILARHAWSRTERLDLFADINRSADAIAAFAGRAEAEGYRQFCARARQVYQTLEAPFIRGTKPTPLSLATGAGVGGLARISPFATLWRALGEHFRDPRLRQLFGRYATYCGASPFLAPATLMLVAHVEQDGVWLVQGGMHALAQAVAARAQAHGATLRYAAEVAAITTDSRRVNGVRLTSGETIAADAVIANTDISALGAGLLGPAAARVAGATPVAARSLSAITWNIAASTAGFPLVRHNVFFSADYQQEFDDIFVNRRLPAAPTVYICAQTRDDAGASESGPDRMLLIVNAPPDGDHAPPGAEALARCEAATFGLLSECGLTLGAGSDIVRTTPADFNRLFPATGGALYGPAPHGAMSPFKRQGARTRLPGLYVAGGSVHPGAGVPMAALSGRQAAAAVLADLR